MSVELSIKSHNLCTQVEQIAEALGAESYVDCDECILELDNDYGTGWISGLNMQNGLGILVIDANLQEKLILNYQNFQNDLLIMGFIDGSEVYYTIEDKTIGAPKLNHIILGPGADHDCKTTIQPNHRVRMVHLQIARHALAGKVDCDVDTLPEQLRPVFRKLEKVAPFMSEQHSPIQVSRALRDTLLCEFQGLERKSYLEAKAWELFAYALRQYRLSYATDSARYTSIARRDIDVIQKAKNHIDSNYMEDLTTQQLARVAGVNENKLQRDFKLLNGLTIRKYITETRMRIARKLLIEDEHSIGDVAQMVGYSHKGYFSKLFALMYGLKPKEFQMESRKTIRRDLHR